jgi:tetratricopeptide (TPR) repeat protein
MNLFARLFRSSPSAESIARAAALMAAGEYENALPLLDGARAAHALAALGECQFQIGQPGAARASTESALQLSTEPDLTRELLGNLYEICRYLGDRPAASVACRALGGRYLPLAELIRAGEPLLRAVAEVDGRRYEIDEVLTGVVGEVRLRLERNRPTLRNAERWTAQAQTLAHEGRFADALALLDRAARLDPHDPQPPYHAGHVLAHQDRPEESRERYRLVERLAPGWMLSRSALALVGHPAFRPWHAAAEGDLPAHLKRQLVERELAAHPTCAHLLHLHGKLAPPVPGGAERAYRRGLEHAEHPDLITRLCVDLAAVVASSQERERLLRRAVELNADLIAAATARIVLAFE